jgi:peptidoglycan/xylan/chitin deacetylase (PgdA/CDA1 family)
MVNTGGRRRHATGVALAGLIVLATVVGPLGPVRSGASPSATPGRTAGGSCIRDTAADLRWVSYLHRTFTGRDLALASAAPWLDRLTDGDPYAAIAASVAGGAAANRVTAQDLATRLLHRAGTAADVAAWAERVASVGPDAVAAQFLASDESFTGAGGTSTGWIDRVYRDVLGRPADGPGTAYWTGRLASGTTRQQVAAAIWWSPAAVRLRIDDLYRRILGRPGDPSGLTYWSAQAPRLGTRGVAMTLAAGPAGWARSQVVFGASPAPQPAPCPRRLRWIPPAGAIVRDLRPLADWGSRLVALTFDDGPDPRWTPQILTVLARHDVRATFFVMGNQARTHPDLVRRELAGGHRLGIHTMDHLNLSQASAATQQREIEGSLRVAEAIAGPGSVRCFRPPYGNRNATTDRISAGLGLATILWSRDGRDWARPGVDAIVAGNLDTRYDGGRAVLLLHDGGTDRTQTVAALDRLIPALKAQGYRFVQLC